MALPTTRLLSWSQMCREADPDFDRLSRQPWVYPEGGPYSNGRRFYERNPIYTPPDDEEE